MTTNVSKLQNKSGSRTGRIIQAVICIAIPLIVGFVSSGITMNQMQSFGTMSKPPLAPPAWLFPIAWTTLYILMGIASLLILRSDSKYRVGAIALYISMLIMNFIWSPVFFNMNSYWMAFGIIIVMWITTIILAIVSWFVDKRAAWCLVPLILWTTFAAYLNAGIAIMN